MSKLLWISVGPWCRYLRAKYFRGINDHKGIVTACNAWLQSLQDLEFYCCSKQRNSNLFSLRSHEKNMSSYPTQREALLCLVKYPGVTEENLFWPTFNALKPGALRLGVRASLLQSLDRLKRRGKRRDNVKNNFHRRSVNFLCLHPCNIWFQLA